MNLTSVKTLYRAEMARSLRTILQSVVSPVLSTSLYFVVFGSAIGSRISEVEGIPYGAFIVPGLIMLMLLTQSVSNASFGIFFPRFSGSVYEILSAPISPLDAHAEEAPLTESGTASPDLCSALRRFDLHIVMKSACLP